MYGRMGNHPTLDSFKKSNNCVKFDLTRFYIPLTTRGRVAAKLGLHREMKDRLSQSVKYPLIPLYNWISRTKSKIKTRL
jgi:RNase P subunit RPR2